MADVYKQEMVKLEEEDANGVWKKGIRSAIDWSNMYDNDILVSNTIC